MYISGQVLSRPNIEEIIKFAKEENLFLMADEVRDYSLELFEPPPTKSNKFCIQIRNMKLVYLTSGNSLGHSWQMWHMDNREKLC